MQLDGLQIVFSDFVYPCFVNWRGTFYWYEQGDPIEAAWRV